MKNLKRTTRPKMATVMKEAVANLQDVEANQQLLDIAARAD